MIASQKENIYNDLMKHEIEEQGQLKEETFWAIYNGLILCYKKSKMKSEIGENCNNFLYRDMSDKQYKSLHKLMKSLPEYEMFFEDENYENNLQEYLKLCPQELIFNGNNYENIIKQTLDRVINYMSKRPETINKVGVDIDKHIYKQEIDNYKENKQLITQDFLENLKSQRGEEGVESLKNYMKDLAMQAIYSQSIYYTKVAKGICNFYANIEMAKNIEEEL